MTKQEALKTIHRFYGTYQAESNDYYDEAIQIAIECIQESITAEELKNDLSNNFEGVPV